MLCKNIKSYGLYDNDFFHCAELDVALYYILLLLQNVNLHYVDYTCYMIAWLS